MRKGPRLPNRLLAVLICLLAMASLTVGIPFINKPIDLLIELTPMIMAMPFGPLSLFLHTFAAGAGFPDRQKRTAAFLPGCSRLGFVADWLDVHHWRIAGADRPRDAPDVGRRDGRVRYVRGYSALDFDGGLPAD
jgi:hypothetical protein